MSDPADWHREAHRDLKDGIARLEAFQPQILERVARLESVAAQQGRTHGALWGLIGGLVTAAASRLMA